MSKSVIAVPYFAAAATGATHAWFATLIWGVYSVNSPINNWLLDLFTRRDRDAAYLFSVFTHDLILNVLLAVPFALLVAYLKPQHSWSYLWIAFAASSIVGHWDIIANPSGFAIMIKHWSFYVGVLGFALSLPLAFVAVNATYGHK